MIYNIILSDSFFSLKNKEQKQLVMKVSSVMKNQFLSIPTPVFIYDTQSLAILAVNEAFTNHYGYSDKEAVILHVVDLFPESERELLNTEKEGLKEFTQIKRNWNQIRKDGSLLHAVLQSNNIEYQEKKCRIVIVTDVTELKRKEQELEIEKSQLRALINTIPDPVWLKDLDGVYLICNSVFENLFGAKESEIVGKTDYDFVDKKTADSFRENDLKSIEANGPSRNEETLRFAANGYTALFETIKNPMYDVTGQLIGVLGIARDISQWRKDQHDLKERVKEQVCLYRIFALTEDISSSIEDKFQQVVERIAPGWQFPELAEVRIDYGDKSFQTANFLKTKWMQAAEATTLKNSIIRLTLVYREEPLMQNGEPFLKEEDSLIITIVRRLADFINRKSSAEALKEHEQLVSTMFSQTTDSIVLVDAETGKFVAFNDSAHLELGYTREEFSELHVQDIQAEHSAEQIEGNVRDTVKGTLIDQETKHRHKDGSLRDVKLRLRPISIEGRAIISAVWRDITEEKIKEKEINAYRLHLEELVVSRTQELEITNQEQAALFDSATIGIALIRDRLVIRCNRKLEEILGYDVGELIGKPTISWYKDEEEYKDIGWEISDSLEKYGIFYKKEIQFYRKDRSPIRIRIKAKLLDSATYEKGLVAIFEDIIE